MPMPSARRPPLSERALRFVAEYLIDFNGTQAATRAGYAPASAANAAWMLLKHPEVAQAVQEHRDKVRKALDQRIELTTERTLNTVSDLAFFDPINMVNQRGEPKNIQEMDRASRMAIAGFEVTSQWVGKGAERRKVVTTRVKLANRAGALDMAAKVLGAYKADNEQRRSAREMTDEELLARAMTLMGGATPPAEPPTDGVPPGTMVQ